MGDYLDTKPHTRIATYLIGMCLAYILIKYEEGRFKVNMKISITGWLLSTFLGFTIVYCTYGTYHEPEWSQALTVFYLTVSRFTFGLAIAWVIFACATGHGGLVNTFLSWNFWLPLSRMSFCTYLVFPLMMAFWLLNNHVQPYVSDFNFMYLFIAYMGIGYLMGFTFALIVERPFMQLERLMFGKGLEQSS
ncbi:nose resistant to fluoxetine protein 6-like [Ptychodera flava]|uniref:nose resistant to fluoxetine protein 6-like n=1 Tax=Ptychodera flava TaxID=63121 RepID=UPI00396A3591